MPRFLRSADMRDAQDAPNILRSPPRLTVVQHTHSLRESVVNRVLLARRQLITAGHDHHVRAASDAVRAHWHPDRIDWPLYSQLVVWGNNHSTLCTPVPELAAVNITCVLQRDIAAALPAFGSSTGPHVRYITDTPRTLQSVTAGPHCERIAASGVKPCDGLMWGAVGSLTWAWNNGDAPYVYWFLRHAASLATEYVWMMEYGQSPPYSRLPNCLRVST